MFIALPSQVDARHHPGGRNPNPIAFASAVALLRRVALPLFRSTAVAAPNLGQTKRASRSVQAYSTMEENIKTLKCRAVS